MAQAVENLPSILPGPKKEKGVKTKGVDLKKVAVGGVAVAGVAAGAGLIASQIKEQVQIPEVAPEVLFLQFHPDQKEQLASVNLSEERIQVAGTKKSNENILQEIKKVAPVDENGLSFGIFTPEEMTNLLSNLPQGTKPESLRILTLSTGEGEKNQFLFAETGQGSLEAVKYVEAEGSEGNGFVGWSQPVTVKSGENWSSVWNIEKGEWSWVFYGGSGDNFSKPGTGEVPGAVPTEPPPSPKETATSTPTKVPTPKETPTKTVAPPPPPPIETLTKTVTPKPTETATPKPTETPKPTPTPEVPKEMSATANIDLFTSPDGRKVGYFVPGQKFTFTGSTSGNYLQIKDSDGNMLWIKKDSAYGVAGEVQRTEKGRYGIGIDWYGKEVQSALYNSEMRSQPHTKVVSPEEEFLFGDNNIMTREEGPEKVAWGGKIVSIDYRTGQATIINRGETIKILFTKDTKFGLWVPGTIGFETVDISQWRVGDVAAFWKFGSSFSPDEVNEIAGALEVK